MIYMTRSKYLASLICNIATIVFVLYAFWAMVSGAISILSFGGINSLKLFTVDSNLLAALGCLLMIPFDIRGLRKPEKPFPKAVLVFKFIGTVAVTVTFMTVMCFLGPISGYAIMLSGPNFWFHLVCPLLCIISLSFFEKGNISIPQSLLGLLPVILYGAWYLTMVIIIGPENGGWVDWYGFNRGGMWPVTIVAMGSATTVFCLLLRLPHRASARQKRLEEIK